MIRPFYSLLVLVEILFTIITILIFLITDSHIIKFATKDILKEYNIKYNKISGNLFTGITIDSVKYRNKNIIEKAVIHWNPFSLIKRKIHISQLDIKGIDTKEIMEIISDIPTSKDNRNPKIDFYILINKINLTTKPLTYAGVKFKNFHLQTKRLLIDKNFHLKSQAFNISVDSKLTDIQIKGKIEKKILSLEDVQLLNIDPKVITSFINNINQNNQIDKTDTSSSQLPIDKITIQTLFATMKKTTYGPITIDKTRALINDIDIDPRNSFNYNAKEVTVSSDTSFASSVQKGFIKNSELFTKGDVITNEYLFRKYSLPLNQQELYALPVSLKLNHTGIGLEIEHSVKNLLVLKNDFNINLDHAKHTMRYNYLDKFISIKSEANGSTTYTDDIKIKNSVDIDFRGESTEINYYGNLFVKSIINIPQSLSHTLLENPKASYRGNVDELLVNFESNQISGSFLTKGYRDADIKLDSKHDILLSKLIPTLPHALQMAQGAIQSQLNIDFQNLDNSLIHIDLDSDIAHISTNIMLLEPYTINYQASIPDNSLLYNIDPKINFFNIKPINGKIIIGEDRQHIEVKNQEFQLVFDYDTKSKTLNSGTLFINQERISFDGSLENSLNATLEIQNIESLTNSLKKYYDIEIPIVSGSAYVTIKRSYDKSIHILIDSPFISYENINGDVNADITIDMYQNINIILNSRQISYEDAIGDIQITAHIDNNKNMDITLNSSSLSYQDFIGDIQATAQIDSNKNININLNSRSLSYRDFTGDITATGTIDSNQNMRIIVNSNKISNKNIQGDINAQISVDDNRNINIFLNSHKISLLKEGKVSHTIHKLSTNVSIFGEEIIISNYSFNLRNNKYFRNIFSNQNSYLSYRNNSIYSKQLWINDEIEVRGQYNIETKKGKIKLLSDYFAYKDKDFDIATTFKLILNLDKEKIFIRGDVNLLESYINYQIKDSGFSEDSDIIIIQEIKEKKDSILNNIKLYVNIENSTPIHYITKDIKLNLLNDITLVKEYNKDIRVLGKITIADGHYIQEDKKFFLDESHIYFYGEPKDAILEIKAKYFKDKYNIQIFISGSSSDPIINFSSNPYLSQREILSLILFDTSASNSGAGTAVYAMLGGTFAKELMKNLGISVDHLLLGEGIDEKLSLEVGKKISDNMTFILQHKNGKDGVKVKIDHSLNFETDIIVQPSSSSIEFLYKSN